jgi:hypothetical protein
VVPGSVAGVVRTVVLMLLLLRAVSLR